MRAKVNNNFSQELYLPVYNLSPQKVTRFLLSIILLLILFNLGERLIVDLLNIYSENQIHTHYFNFDGESNFPSLYSALAIGFCSYLLAIATTINKLKKARYTKHWKALSLIFLYLAIDEACSIHELAIPLFKGVINAKGILYFTWVVPAFLLLIVFLIAFRKFIFSLPAKTKTLFILAGFVYVTGALGMELVSGYIVDNFGFNTLAYGLATCIEEILEMLGIVVFVYALLSHLQSQTTKLHFSMSFQQQSKKAARLSI